VPVTPVYQLPYPAESDVPDVPGDMQRLAEAVDTALGPVPDTWHSFNLLAGVTAGVQPAYTKYPDGTVELAGNVTINVSDFTDMDWTDGFSDPSYYPKAMVRVLLCTDGKQNAGVFWPRMQIGLGGNLRFLRLPAGKYSVYLDGIRYRTTYPAPASRWAPDNIQD
jgi:hypothetical protein